MYVVQGMCEQLEMLMLHLKIGLKEVVVPTLLIQQAVKRGSTKMSFTLVYISK
jgi:hypothetical protein